MTEFDGLGFHLANLARRAAALVADKPPIPETLS